MEQSTVRILVVDDYDPWRSFLRNTLKSVPGLLITGEVSDGLEAVQKASELQPDLVLLDIGLPTLNGIEVARRIRKVSPKSKILFVSQESSLDVVEEALKTGAEGYIMKPDAGGELSPALNSLLQGGRFLGDRFRRQRLIRWPQREMLHHHEVGFYSDDRALLSHLSQFVQSALKVGNAVIVAATQPHHDGLLLKLDTDGMDIGAAIRQGSYVSVDANETLSTFMVNGLPDPIRFEKAFGSLILEAASRATAEHPRVAIFGECVHLLWAGGNPDAAIQMERLGNELTKRYDVDIRCGYSPQKVPGGMDHHFYEQVCSEHSAICSR